ncbi:MAG: VanW family protein [Myxococcales bacterium]|nr:VanW family protein [Myxococcales bacterium]
MWRRLSLTTALVLALGLGSSLGQPARASETDPRVTVGGVPVALGADPHEVATRLAEAWLAEPVDVALPGRVLRRSRASLGASVDVARLERWLREAGDAESPMRSAARAQLPLRMPARLDPSLLRPWLESLKRDIDRPSKDATLDPDTGDVVPEREGRVLDVWRSLDRVAAAFAASEAAVELAIDRRLPGRTADELAHADVATVLGEFETPYNGSGDAADRTHNLRVVASKIDGLVLMPGDVFDFNGVVGERSLANGFKPAPVIAGGELVDGVGGGACQIAGTLHAAAYFAGLEIVERQPHSRPSSYIRLGLDAAVAWPNINFRFRNDRDTPVLVRLLVRGGAVRAELRGAERPELVSFVRRVEEVFPYDEREVSDPRLPVGVRVLSQRGVPGFRVAKWRVRRHVERNQVVSERSEDRYPPTQQIWRVGAGGAAPEGFTPPSGDTHGEYVADEYLVSSQGPGVTGTTTIRRAGRTGARGWTAALGMPQP